MTRTVEQIKEKMLDYKYNPPMLARLGIDILEEASNGSLEFVDVTNPVIATISACATMVASFIDEAYVLTRKQYPYSAQNFEDLYPHMSDKDHVNRFAIPSHCDFMFVIDVSELEKRMVRIGYTENYMLVIPRNSKVKIGEIVFSLQYPIEIKRFNNGGYRLNHNITKPGPLRKIKNNTIDSLVIATDSSARVLTFSVTMDQFDIVSKIMHLSTSSVNSITIPFADHFCHARVWVRGNGVDWKEIPITYTDTIYPINQPTACLEVGVDSVRVKIPQIYVNSNVISGSVRIDVYHTRGDIAMNLSNYGPENYEAEWLAIDPNERDAFVAPLEAIRGIQLYSKDMVRGGLPSMTFQQLYNRVISNSVGSPELPLTQLQIESGYERNGFKLSRMIDNLSNRVYLAIRPMPSPTNSDLLTACAAGVETFNDTVSAISAIDSVIINGPYTTILPSTLYKREGGTILVVRQEEVNIVNSASGMELPDLVAKNKYVFSPFHYVLNTSNNDFTSQVYWLNDPVINWKSYIDENESTLFTVSTATATIEKTESGYNILVKTTSGVQYKKIQNDKVFAQLSFTSPVNDNVYIVNGTSHGITADHERIFRFSINTSYLINTEHQMELVNFFNKSSGEFENAFIDLDQEFNIVYGTSELMPVGWNRSVIDSMIGFVDIPDSSKAITQEKISVTLGENLNYLWSRARSVISEEFYERYTVDVYETYGSDIYERDTETNSIFTFDDKGEIVYNIKYKAGDVVINKDGSKKIKYSAGDVKIDSFGQKIVSDPRKIRRQFDIIILDGVYKFANTKTAKDYVVELARQVVKWVNVDIPELDKTLLELTKIYFYPTKTIGLVDVMYNNGNISTIDSAQTFKVSLYVSPTLFDSSSLRESVRRTTVQTIDRTLSNGTVAVSDLVNAIRTSLSDNVLGVDLNGFGVNGDMRIVSMVDKANSLSINKRLSYRDDGTLSVVEDVDVVFIKHDLVNIESFNKG